MRIGRTRIAADRRWSCVTGAAGDARRRVETPCPRSCEREEEKHEAIEHRRIALIKQPQQARGQGHEVRDRHFAGEDERGGSREPPGQDEHAAES